MIIYYAKGQEKSPLYYVICIFRAKMRYVILRGMTKSLISDRMDVENSISTLIFQILNALNILSPVLVFLLIPFLTHYRFSMLQFLKSYVSFLTCFWNLLESTFLFVD